MSQKLSNPTTPLPKSYRKVQFGDTIDTVKIIGVEYDEDNMVEVVKVMVHPMTDDEFYAELYMEDLGEWNFVD
jgi:bifunctional DNase/RNase